MTVCVICSRQVVFGLDLALFLCHIGGVGWEMSAVSFEVEVLEGPPKVGVVRAVGYIEAVQSRILREKLNELEKKGARRIIIDLRDVLFISSSGFSLLVNYVTRKKEEWGADCVLLVAPAPPVMQTIRVLGLESFFSILPDMETALKKVGLK
ncbi:MAG: hypothetical protein DRP63_00590 [Planctomycetota bacterium]|nr:MAG: hypothetical protein DRP63_00590 [Planctomycetota bacterium]